MRNKLSSIKLNLEQIFADRPKYREKKLVLFFLFLHIYTIVNRLP